MFDIATFCGSSVAMYGEPRISDNCLPQILGRGFNLKFSQLDQQALTPCTIDIFQAQIYDKDTNLCSAIARLVFEGILIF